METITNTLQNGTFYVYTLPSGNVAVVEASFTFGQIAIIVLLLFLVLIAFARLARDWRY